ncbi:N-acetyltransferase [Phaeobacter sp. QD34_3]|uniref:GNAT family N-acetyltransferase n=1 Tax=unclassified Phaeobacter TaxID=2621772 RepID=UPI00237F0BE2|nr:MULTISPECIES: N-acetyltransferase [unclassified Phaeobacter]MDE4134209.1 N-acetyltransferase [Phaeobacter sp. QD34_3]MDE4137868.1 N-acetyltransferase [Phaeobacter sp. QD34_24]
MEMSSQFEGQKADITALFNASFSQSEGAEEGQLIANLVTEIFATTAEEDLYAFSAVDQGAVTACILFTRMTYANDDRCVFLLSPVAVTTEHQGKGIGQDLLRHGLNQLKDRGVDVVLTYGDINFYSKVGFKQITERDAAAPLPLSYPHGWLGQSLRAPSLEPLIGPASCVSAFQNPDLW